MMVRILVQVEQNSQQEFRTCITGSHSAFLLTGCMLPFLGKLGVVAQTAKQKQQSQNGAHKNVLGTEWVPSSSPFLNVSFTIFAELWLEYIREELSPRGNPENCGKIHWRAMKSLEDQCVERFVSQYTLLQTGHIQGTHSVYIATSLRSLYRSPFTVCSEMCPQTDCLYEAPKEPVARHHF